MDTTTWLLTAAVVGLLGWAAITVIRAIPVWIEQHRQSPAPKPRRIIVTRGHSQLARIRVAWGALGRVADETRWWADGACWHDIKEDA
jgi:hypothetical protein